MQFSRRRISNDALNICLMIADRNWLGVSSQIQGLLKEMDFVIGFQLYEKPSVLILLILCSRSILFKSESRSSSVMTVLNSALQTKDKYTTNGHVQKMWPGRKPIVRKAHGLCSSFGSTCRTLTKSCTERGSYLELEPVAWVCF